MTISAEVARRLMVTMEQMAWILSASHQAAGHHQGGQCPTCNVINQALCTVNEVFERRKARRISYSAEVKCVGGVCQFSARVTDLSTTGAFLSTAADILEGTIIEMNIPLGPTEVPVKCEVCYCMPHIGMGIRFKDMRPEDCTVIEGLIQTESKRFQLLQSDNDSMGDRLS